MKKLIPLLFICSLLLTACGEEGKIENLKKTAVNNCSGKTMQDLAAGLLKNPVWALKKEADGKEIVTLSGTMDVEMLPAWVKDQKMLDITFNFALDPKTHKFDPASLDGFPSPSREGIFQGYKVFICK
ncbi:MAG: hypothetical protein LBN33_02595 [Desulfovibrio sp.]|jgi:hypothetical protein|nr:hypothetical protein [Desulfovibrio sp.]